MTSFKNIYCIEIRTLCGRCCKCIFQEGKDGTTSFMGELASSSFFVTSLSSRSGTEGRGSPILDPLGDLVSVSQGSIMGEAFVFFFVFIPFHGGQPRSLFPLFRLAESFTWSFVVRIRQAWIRTWASSSYFFKSSFIIGVFLEGRAILLSLLL